MANEYKIFKCLDKPVRILFWKVDEFCILAGSMLLGAISESLSLMFAGIIVYVIWRGAKKRMDNHSWKLLLYWHLGIILKSKLRTKMIPSFIRNLRG